MRKNMEMYEFYLNRLNTIPLLNLIVEKVIPDSIYNQQV
jgi:hypothetical protein